MGLDQTIYTTRDKMFLEAYGCKLSETGIYEIEGYGEDIGRIGQDFLESVFEKEYEFRKDYDLNNEMSKMYDQENCETILISIEAIHKIYDKYSDIEDDDQERIRRVTICKEILDSYYTDPNILIFYWKSY